MGFKKDFNVNITRLTTAVAQKGFGTILILSNEKDQVLTICENISDVSAIFANTTKTYKLAEALFAQNVDKVKIVGKLTAVPSELVNLLNATVVNDDSWFGLVCSDNATATISAISNWTSTQEKIYAVTSQSKVITNSSNNTIVGYHPTQYMMESALAYMLVREIGSTDLDGKKIDGVTSSLITATEYAVFKTNHINVAVEKFGNIVIDGGNMAGGEKFDVMLGQYWIKARMEEDLAILKINSGKIPYTDDGIALLVDVATKRLKLATRQGIIATLGGVPQFEVTYLPITEVPTADKANRDYSYVKWEAVLAGAIRTGTIQGILKLD
jgi:hypothetical protein